MTKNILLAATAASVMAFAGAASAHSITFRATVTPTTDIDDGAVSGTGAARAYQLAQEAKTPTSANTFALTDSLSSGTLPSGNVILTVSLVGNAVFSTAPTAASITGGAGCTTFTAAPSTAPTATTATFIISNSAPDCSSFNMDLIIQVTGAGNVSVTTTLATDGAGTPIDGGSTTKLIVNRPDAFALVVDPSIAAPRTLGNGAYGDTRATLDVTPVYTTFKTGAGFHSGAPETGTTGVLGTAAILVDQTARYDLVITSAVTLADVVDADAVVTGNFSALTAAFGGVAGTANAGRTTMTHNNIQGGIVEDKAAPTITATNEYTVAVRAAPNNVIPSSGYSLAVAYELNAARYNQETAAPAALEPIERDGTNIIFPWMNSSSIQTANGTTNLIRLSNVSGVATGAVYAQVLNAANSASGYTAATAPVQIFPNIAVGGERVINTAALTTALGDFGRGDVQISIEARPEQVTARRYATLANGSVTEFESGTVANDQGVGVVGVTPNYIP